MAHFKPVIYILQNHLLRFLKDTAFNLIAINIFFLNINHHSKTVLKHSVIFEFILIVISCMKIQTNGKIYIST